MRASSSVAASRFTAPFRRARRAVGLLGAALAVGATVLAPTPGAAQTITPRCSATTALGCSALRLDVVAGSAPLALATLGVQLTGDYVFAGGATSAFAAEDDFSFGTPFGGTAQVTNGRDLFLDFLASPGFTFELGPGSAGYVEFALQGQGEFSVSYQGHDPDAGSPVDGSGRVSPNASSVVPEPSTVALLAAGMLGTAVLRRRRAV